MRDVVGEGGISHNSVLKTFRTKTAGARTRVRIARACKTKIARITRALRLPRKAVAGPLTAENGPAAMGVTSNNRMAPIRTTFTIANTIRQLVRSEKGCFIPLGATSTYL